jgi:hypothetical protein
MKSQVRLKLKQFIKKTPLYFPLHNWLTRRRQKKEITDWERNGKPIPPPHIIKQRTIKTYAKKFKLKTFIETGTLYGDMVEAMRYSFNQIYSIELSKVLYESARERFKDVHHVELIHGDSGIELENLMKRISEPALFWLDGHFSAGETVKGNKDTPIYDELNHILNAQDLGHVIIIDDARCFGTDPSYPSIEELTTFIKSKRAATKFDIQDDSIRITPK